MRKEIRTVLGWVKLYIEQMFCYNKAMMETQTFIQYLIGEGCSEQAAAASVQLVRAFVAFVHGRTSQWPQSAREEDVDAFLRFFIQKDQLISHSWGRLLSFKGCLHVLGAYFRYLHREDLAFHTCVLWEGVEV
jgi:hypothetical protein